MAAPPPTSASPPAPPQPHAIVGIGASAGGLDALETLTSRLTATGLAYVIVQHLAPTYQSMLPEILARRTPLKVLTAGDGTIPEPNTIYVAPPDSDIVLVGGVLRARPPSDHAPRDSIDVLFRSLALDRGATAFGVVLSGAGSDGSLGLKAIAAAGGVTFAQTPGTASHPGMPQSAIDAGCVDFCLSPAEIGDELMRQAELPVAPPTAGTRLISPESLKPIFVRLQQVCGVDFSTYKATTIERRIERRMALQNVERIEDYVKLVETSTEEAQILYDELLIGVTGFFRDREPFEALVTTVFPKLFATRSREVPIRIWVPAAATGEEVYSIAMCLMEYLGPRAAGQSIQIFGSDIDDVALHRARQGIYPSGIKVDVSPERLERFFTEAANGYQINRQLRDLIVFAHHDLAKDPPFSQLDLVSCRNVLIYLQPTLQKRVLSVFHYGLRRGGHLLLGTSESVGDAVDLFTMVDRKLKIYEKKDISSVSMYDVYPAHSRPTDGPRPSHPAPVGVRPPPSPLEVADRKVLERYGPPGVLVNASFDVIQFRGRTGAFLDPQPGNATFNLFKLVRGELLIELRSAVLKAMGDGEPVTTPPIAMWGGSGPGVCLDVLPLPHSDPGQKWLLVLFREVPAPPTGATPTGAAAPDGVSARSESLAVARADQLERELVTTKEYLEAAVQDLQAANEELQSSNEELQSSNEELETSKEELQSSNEELATINEELHNRMGQLAVSNDDLQNILENAGTPMVIVGGDLRIRRYSQSAEKLLKLVPADVGRPVEYLSGIVKAEVGAAVSTAMSTGVLQEQRVRCTDEHWYTMRIAPCRNGDVSNRGVSMELLRTPLMRKFGEPADIHEFVGKVLSTLPHALALLDDQLRLAWVNKRFFDTFQAGAEILGQPLDDVWPGRSTNPELWSRLDAVAAGGEAFVAQIVEHPFGRTAPQRMSFSAHRVPGEGDRATMTLLVMEEQPDAGQK